MAASIELKDRFRGSLLGLAVGDAVGTTVDNMPRGSFPPVTDMVGGGRFSLLAGQWTDDTSMALILAESLIEKGAFDPMHQGSRYWKWYQSGHLSSTGLCFNVGVTVRGAVSKFNPVPDRRRPAEEPIRPFPGSVADWAAGNGSLTRLCPVPLFLHKYPEVAMDLSVDSSKITHGGVAASDSCRYFAGLLLGCLQGVSKEELLSPRYSPVPNHYEEKPLVPEVDAVACGSFKTTDEEQIKAISYVVSSLEAALWAFYHTDNYKDGCLKVVNLGNDADTAGAIYGQLAGAYYGVGGIPEEWRKRCFLSSLILLFADELHRLSFTISEPPPMNVLESTYLRGMEKYAGDVSEEYRNIKMRGFDQLEEYCHDIVRRAHPYDRQYENVDELVRATEEVRARYLALPPETQSESIMADFDARWKKIQHDFLNRPSRFFY
jgi:ADP-ribosylglycohydrolase